jgi:hypothetical protein
MIFKRRRIGKKDDRPIGDSTVSLQFNDLGNPWKEENGRNFTLVGVGGYVEAGMMRNPNGKNSYITTPDASELRLTGDFTLKVGIRGWAISALHTSLYQKGTPGNGVAPVGQFFIYGTESLYVTSDNGGLYDVFNGVSLIKNSGSIDLTLVRKNAMLYAYCGNQLVGSTNVAGKTFGNNASPLHINGGDLMYTYGFAGGLDYWELNNGKAIFPE